MATLLCARALVSTSAQPQPPASNSITFFPACASAAPPSRSQLIVFNSSSSSLSSSNKKEGAGAALKSGLTAVAAAVILSLAAESPPSTAAAAYEVYYGTAASAANYGGYGGNSSKKESAEYVYEVPEGWKERLVSKVEKGTNGTDSEFYNPKSKGRAEREYLTFLSGFRQLPPSREAVLNNLALSDVSLQDQIADADSLSSQERTTPEGQLYYDYEIEAAGGSHSLISVTCANNKLYAHFVNAPAPEWSRDHDLLSHIHQSFHTLY